VKLPEKIEISRKFAWTNRHFVDPDPPPPYFKPDWRRWPYAYTVHAAGIIEKLVAAFTNLISNARGTCKTALLPHRAFHGRPQDFLQGGANSEASLQFMG